jgi:hypothetical protein
MEWPCTIYSTNCCSLLQSCLRYFCLPGILSQKLRVRIIWCTWSLDNMVDKAKLTEYMEKANSLETKVCFVLSFASFCNVMTSGKKGLFRGCISSFCNVMTSEQRSEREIYHCSIIYPVRKEISEYKRRLCLHGTTFVLEILEILVSSRNCMKKRWNSRTFPIFTSVILAALSV